MLLKLLHIRKNIRKTMRFFRKSLTVEQQYNESIKISSLSLQCNYIYNAKNIAVFLPFDGEINTYPFVKQLWLRKIKVFLPIIHSFSEKKLLFAPFTSNSLLYFNKYNILEPIFNCNDIISLSSLDVVIVPLVAFDQNGSRLGMGGGFYDILLQKWNKKKFLPIGFAYNFQLVNYIPCGFWDIPLPVVLTPKKIWFF